MKDIFLETQRLRLCQMDHGDFSVLSQSLQDIRVMYAWEHAFSDQEVREWIDRNTQRYRVDGFGYFIAVEKASGTPVGQIGLIREELEGKSYVALGYILNHTSWGKGFAREGAKALLNYAFSEREDILKVIADIRPENIPSIQVAKSLGMTEEGSVVKYYYGQEMPHLIYAIDKHMWRFKQ